MSWGIEGPFSIPDGTTWDGSATGRGWESSGASMNWYGFNYEFHVYYDVYPWTTLAWTEITSDLKLEAFTTRRGVKSWWQGIRANSATLTLDYTGSDGTPGSGGSHADDYFDRTNRVRITVDTPGGEKSLFTGFVINRTKVYDAKGYPKIRVQLLDHVGYTAQSVFPVRSNANQTTGWILHSLIRLSGAAISDPADVAGINTADGLTQNITVAGGNLVDKLNQYVRGELGLLWVDSDGVWQFRERDWWYPQPDPVATIGSLDRGGGGDRDDPVEGDTGLKFPGSVGSFWGKITYTDMTWTYNTGTANVAGTGAGTGLRFYKDTTELNNFTDANEGVTHLFTILFNNPLSGHDWDSTGTLRFAADMSLDAMAYAATVDVGDFVEVAKETQARLSRTWEPAWVMGMKQSWSPQAGWNCELELEMGLAQYDTDSAL